MIKPRTKAGNRQSIRCSSLCDMPPVNTRTFLRATHGQVAPCRPTLGSRTQKRFPGQRLGLRVAGRIKMISVRAALARLAFVNHHQGTCSYVGLDMSDVLFLLVGRRLCTLRATCSTSAELPMALSRVQDQNKQAFETATSAVVIMTSGYDKIAFADIGAAWRILRANPPGVGNVIYATCTHPTFGRRYELVVLLGFSRKQLRGHCPSLRTTSGAASAPGCRVTRLAGCENTIPQKRNPIHPVIASGNAGHRINT
jgi:hypothetical protein